MQKLNLGCGRDYRRGYINLDISEDVGADLVHDFTMLQLPFDDDSISEVIANNCLTQVFYPLHFLDIMNELWRVTNGDIYIRVPNAEHICAWQDPMDCRRFTDQSFTYMQYDHRRYDQYGKHYGFKPFKVELLDNNGVQMNFKLTPIK